MQLADIIAASIVGTFAIEFATIIARFGFHLRSGVLQRRMRFLHGIRLHHGYVGILLLIWAVVGPSPNAWFWVSGISLISSDILHHWCILRWMTGTSEWTFFTR